jgi:hypothetical protein
MYNQKRHIELLKRSQDLKNQGKNLFQESREEDVELSEYNIAVEEYIFWQERHNLALSMEDFLNRKIDGEELCGRVYGLRRELMNAVEKFKLDLISGKIKDFQPDERSNELSGFLTGFFCECDHFMEDYENEEFYISIKNGFFNLQKVLTEN